MKADALNTLISAYYVSTRSMKKKTKTSDEKQKAARKLVF